MPRRANCAICAVAIQLGGGSLPPGQATCRGCRKVDRLPFDPTKCGTPRGRDQHRHRGEPCCEPCRVAWNEVSNTRRKDALARGWVRPDREAPKVMFRSGNCSDCGQTLVRAALDDPALRHMPRQSARLQHPDLTRRPSRDLRPRRMDLPTLRRARRSGSRPANQVGRNPRPRHPEVARRITH